MLIQKLPIDVIKLIAAGEVIDSLSAVVRELAENSLDAGAGRIVISIQPSLWRVQVADNGRGMDRDDLFLCTQAHTTSKIKDYNDLHRINTLGFRGEALHSIAQLADVKIVSRVADDCGYEICCHDNHCSTINPVAIAPGTIITVENLFKNIPLRRQANPPFKQQIKQIQTLIGQLSLCHPQVTWQLFVDDKLTLYIHGDNEIKKILSQLSKTIKYHDLTSQQITINTPEENSLSHLDLVLGLPDRLSRPRPDWVKIGLNGRVIKSPELESSIYSAFHRTLGRDRFPVIFLHLKTSPRQIDWNRHPAKAEIYLHNLDFWQEQIISAINNIFKITDNNINQKIPNSRVENILKVAENKALYHIEEKPKKIDKKESLGLINLQVIAQSRNTYIIAEHDQGMWLIEQHIAHERILYEQLQDNWQLMPLSQPIILENLLSKQIEQLTHLQLDIESFGENLWAVRNIPQMLAQRNDMADALMELSWGGNVDNAMVAVACRSAIRNGTKLTIEQMQDIVDRWKMTRNPHTCPHGRPIYLSLEESSLYRFFRRHWVLGKSHGI
ncbi:DNA mismatch repair endonuclease MutL [Cyanobacterium stanieri LEGE 03274]|uniref:DNA mismatch repair protein MutL n=1 Tax=Cyanobacterium stanieri LEGE 03274 TaxID=1828756 RepID=A0ABR9V0W1_9CHRO|nr:DNA mismatch repair endonuclease MutL [Cyanobacterium stanieri]MBE9221523.1 DNA mismatch repair endonuclease MutL [Cyanobacterium stanieri LEGE 03274]